VDTSALAVPSAAAERRSPRPLPTPIAKPAGDKSPPLICRQVFDSISIHANGDIVCWCIDVNGERVYGNVFEDRIADVWNGPAYREIREWLLQSRPDTWCPAINRHCPLRNIPATSGFDTSAPRIKTLKLEPVTYCNLQCPVCPVETGFKQDPILREARGQKLLPLEIMLDVVAQLPDLELIEYFDYGEPFIHRDTVTFLREVKRTRPGVSIVTSTNGTVLTPAQIHAIATEKLMDRVVFSIDGATAESYRKYRVGGTFSKAFGKMKALVDACRAAGTWQRYVTDRSGGVQIAWQYILFEWNDSDEEIALARKLAKEVGVPIEWTITSGYGASKRFLTGSAAAARLMDPPDSFIHLAANSDIEYRLKQKAQNGKERSWRSWLPSFLAPRAKSVLDEPLAVFSYSEIQTHCELLSLPYRQDGEGVGYRARIHTDQSVITAPVGSTVDFKISIQNMTGQTWDVGGSNCLRLGCLLQSDAGATIKEIGGAVLPASVARPGGRDTISLRVNLPDQPGRYKLILDVVQEWVCWFFERGSLPLTFTVQVD
jgi:MoaA/NifB/PqqE/SkfB family radical SAM enzyme